MGAIKKKKKKARLEFISKNEPLWGFPSVINSSFSPMYLIAKLTITVLYDFLDNM